ncbi:MAG: hypothetical protein AAFY84_10410 [Pseudomonadota bacterium]
MERWRFIAFGGDTSSPAVKRMCWRMGLAGFIAGFVFGFTSPDQGEVRGETASIVLALTLLVSSFVITYESYRFYAASDELVKHLMERSLAITGLVIVGLQIIYGLGQMIYAWPSPQVIWMAGGAFIIMSVSWIITAWKST